jgi:sugar transferase (PEP-CTERM system associated)
MILKIFNQYIPIRKVGFIFFESLLILGMVFLAVLVRFNGSFGLFLPLPDFFSRALVVMVVVQLSFHYFDLYTLRKYQRTGELIFRVLQALGASFILLAGLYYFIPNLFIGRGILLINLCLIAVISINWRIFYNFLVMTSRLGQRVLVVGTSALAINIVKMVLQKKDAGFHVVGFISHDQEKVGTPLVNPGIIGDYSQIIELVNKNKIDRIIVALEERRGKFPAPELLACKMSGISVEDGLQFYEHLTGRLQVEHLKPSFLIFSEGFRNSNSFLLLKRINEVGWSLIGVFLLFPLMALIALLIKIDSRGPVFYKQERLGWNGKAFRLIKFRSMTLDAEANGAVWAKVRDDRVTRVGRFLRASRLDELPQLINVLRGDMSFVGPRPERPCFVEELRKEIPYYDQRLAVKPGITGWAQIRYQYGASIEDAREKLKFDLYYVKNMSFLFDLLIIFETVKVVLLGRGAR